MTWINNRPIKKQREGWRFRELQACDELRKVAPNQLAQERPSKGYDVKAHESFLKSVQEYIGPLRVARYII